MPKDLVTEDGYGSPGEMGARPGWVILVKEKHELEAWKFLLCSSLYDSFIGKMGINYCLSLGSPKSRP